MKLTRPFLSLVVLAVAVPAASAQEMRIEPPMRIASQAPLQSLRLGLLPVVPVALARGEMRVSMSATWTNVWINDRPSVLLDYEAVDARLTVDRGLSARTQLSLEVDDHSGFGGLLDPLIQDFHRRIGNGLDGRDSVRRDSVHIVMRDRKSGRILISRNDASRLSSGVSLTLTRTLPSRIGNLAYAGTVRFPIAHSGDSSTAPDAGLSAAWSRNIHGRSVHLGAGVTRFGTNALDALPVDRFQKTAFAAVVQPLTPRTEAIGQYLFNSGVARWGALSESAHEISVGGRIRLNDRTALEFGLLENAVHVRNGPDLGIHFGLTRR